MPSDKTDAKFQAYVLEMIERLRVLFENEADSAFRYHQQDDVSFGYHRRRLLLSHQASFLSKNFDRAEFAQWVFGGTFGSE